MSDKKVSYYYEADASSHYFSDCHPMIPERINITHELVQNYNLFAHMEVMRYNPATANDLKGIHLSDYIDFLKNATPSAIEVSELYDEDCPIFNGIYDFTSKIVGGSLAAANQINEGTSDICINWSGGMHHAKKRGPSGFCYTNDIVACIVELLRHHQRVMYIDLDVHHGDGVEEFFYDTNRVMTISFHQYGNFFFPGTGSVKDKGVNAGKNYAINVPLKKGINDMNYLKIFKEVINKAVERYQPEALVLQMGADSVTGDKLGGFNLSSEGHAKCLKHALQFQIPAVILGGGGYSIYNVARTWTLETGVALGKELDNVLPNSSYLDTSFFEHLRIPRDQKPNLNSPAYIARILEKVRETIENTEIAPSVQIHSVPGNWNQNQPTLDMAEDLDPDTRYHQILADRTRQHKLEYDQRFELDVGLQTYEVNLLESQASRSDPTVFNLDYQLTTYDKFTEPSLSVSN